MPVVDAAWEEWLSSNVARGCSPGSMIDAMVQAGFATEAARFYLGSEEKVFSKDGTCVNDAQKTRINLCSPACTATLGLWTRPEVRCP